ncbi:hypothetical protein GCM10011371_02980 [Novosphingobium marinum]|uniref:Glutathione S-transferase n=1 Tax=Novosphingobium marinum TaxID=1514948 RepID=A0A7Y9XV74_9SPHN|nr:hypothetical protein [Novosphingobium marinum]NYH93990.1 glutathione S-transferase [Novosphingobium marinum]GGC18762.1 hypothetical protein GCM10011371_02980 [Novosphingobium marinum]
MSDFTPVDVARKAGGMRLIVTAGIPNPWGEAAKGIFRVKQIEHLRVAQFAGEENPEIVAWTGLNSGPIAVWEEEPARDGWADILMLAERIAPEPSLLPGLEHERAEMFGLLHELCGEDGFAWNRRLFHFASLPRSPEVTNDPGLARLRRKYGHGGDVDHCKRRMIDVLGLLTHYLVQQRDRGSGFYFGNDLTAADIYSACFMAMIKPLPLELCPTDPALHASYGLKDADVLAAADPILLEHRDRIYDRWLELPMRL